jgi:TonB-dependent SusC/RagA subfamily outer membrane receptor
MPGSSLSVRVRGTTSVQASNEPLYVVDGVPSDDISHISADDIESMQVLKDASSSAIYGARAANGVVIITTKRGHSGQTSVRFNAYAGVSRLSNGIEALNTEQYKELMTELGKTTAVVPVIPEDENRYTDWEDVLFGTGIILVMVP